MKKNLCLLISIILLASCSSKIENSLPEKFVPSDVLVFAEINMDSYMDMMGDQYVELIENMINSNDEDENFELLKNMISSIDKVYAFSVSEEKVLNKETLSKMNVIMISKEDSSEKMNALFEADSSEKKTGEYKGISYTVSGDNMYLYRRESWILFSWDKDMFFKSLDNAAGGKNFFRNSPAAAYYKESSPVEMFLAVPDLTETVAATPAILTSPFKTVQGLYGNITSSGEDINISLCCEFADEASAASVKMMFSLSMAMMQNSQEFPPEMAQQMELFSSIQITQDENVLEMSLPIGRELINSLFRLYSGQIEGVETF